METDLFVHFAEIAGVFVGFGALISLRSARPTDPHDVVYIQAVLGLGVWVVIAALGPIAVSRYGVQDDALWRPCALVALAIWVIFVGLPLHVVIAGSLGLIIFGVRPGIDEALYITALTAGVIFAGYTLLMSGMSQTHAPTPDQDGL